MGRQTKSHEATRVASTSTSTLLQRISPIPHLHRCHYQRVAASRELNKTLGQRSTYEPLPSSGQGAGEVQDRFRTWPEVTVHQHSSYEAAFASVGPWDNFAAL